MTLTTKEGIKKALTEGRLLEDLSSTVNHASRLRACGIRLVAEPVAIEALNELAAAGDETAAVAVANIFPNGHPEVMDRGPQ